MSTLLNNCYFVKVSTKGKGSKIPQILSTWFVHVPLASFFVVMIFADGSNSFVKEPAT